MGDIDEIKKLLLNLTRKVDRLDIRINRYLEKPEKKTWVKAKVIMAKTGWNHYDMHAARTNRTIIWKKNETSFWYLLESIPEGLLLK